MGCHTKIGMYNLFKLWDGGGINKWINDATHLYTHPCDESYQNLEIENIKINTWNSRKMFRTTNIICKVENLPSPWN